MAGVPDVETRARDLLPAEVYDCYAGGSGREDTLRDNPVAWSRVRAEAGLAVDGAPGVQAVLDGLADDLAHAMALAGAATVAEVTPDLLVP